MTTKQISPRSKWLHRAAIVVFAVATLSTVFFGLRTYGSFRLLRSAYDAGAPMTSSIRAWMTLNYVAATYRTSNSALIERLGLTPGTDPNTSLKSLAEQAGVPPSLYAQRVQRAIADIAPNVRPDRTNETSGWLGTIGDEVLTALLVYGYPILGLILVLGAIGLPLPDGVATTVAGSLAAQGRMDWVWAGTITVTDTIAEAMKAVRIGRTAIYQAIKCGELRAVKRGRRALILAEDLRSWMRNLPSMHRPYSRSS